jgi:large repetitive protein
VIEGAPKQIKIERAGQLARLRFEGKAGQKLKLVAENQGTDHMGVFTIVDATDTAVADMTVVANNLGTLELPPLPKDGIYTLLAAPFGAEIGTFLVSLRNQ